MADYIEGAVYGRIVTVPATGITTVISYPANVVASVSIENLSSAVAVKIGGPDFDPTDTDHYSKISASRGLGLSVDDSTTGGLKLYAQSDSGSVQLSITTLILKVR